MSTLIKADIFFFVTTISVFLITISILITLYYFTRFFRGISVLSKKLENNVDDINTHIEEVAKQIKESFLFNLVFTKGKKRKKDK